MTALRKLTSTRFLMPQAPSADASQKEIINYNVAVDKARSNLFMLMFVAIVCVPVGLSTIYYGLIASKRYVSETQFVVRGVASTRSGGLDALFRTFGISRAVDDANAVENFIRSRDAVRTLETRLPLREMFQRPEGDRLARFPRLWRNESIESLYDYFLDRVTIAPDTGKGITILTVTTFRPDDSHLIATELLNLAEDMVNRMNDRARRDTVDGATREVEEAMERVKQSQLALTQFRNSQLIVDPALNSKGVYDVLAKLAVERARVNADISETTRTTPNAPALQSLRNKSAALTTQIDQQKAQLGGGDDSLATKVATYEKLVLDRTLADKALENAFATRIEAEDEAQRKSIYIETIVAPNYPDEAIEPRRLRAVATVFVTGFAIFAMIWILLVGAREHAQQ